MRCILTPQVGQFGQELFQALAAGSGPAGLIVVYQPARALYTVYVETLYRVAGQDYCRHYTIRAAVAAGVYTPGSNRVNESEIHSLAAHGLEH